jgi:hypothetical protein
MKSPWIIALSMLVLSECGDDDDKCLPPAVSSLSYTYTGDINGAYAVEGEVPVSTPVSMTIYDYSWAMGGTFGEFGTYWVAIHSNLVYESQHSGRASLIVQIHVPDKGVGKYNLPDHGLDFLSLEYSPAWNGELSFEFVSGEVNVTYYQCNRIIGTFSGELQGFDDGEPVTIYVADGKFDVKVRPI